MATKKKAAAKKVQPKATKKTKTEEFNPEKLNAQQQAYLSAAADILKTYGGKEAEDVLMQRTGASAKAAKWALDTARKTGAEVKAEKPGYQTDPKFRFEERVQNQMKKGTSRAEAEAMISRVIETKELAPDVKPAAENSEVPLEKLALGQHFSTETSDSTAARKGGWPVVARTGYLMERGAGSAVVMLDSVAKVTKSFATESGKSIEFETSGKSRQRWALDTVVTALKEVEDLSLLSEKSGVQFGSGQTDQGDNSMASKKSKTAKKSNGAGRPAKTTIQDRFEVVKAAFQKAKTKTLGLKDFRKALEGKFANRSAVKAELVAAKLLKFDAKERTVSLA